MEASFGHDALISIIVHLVCMAVAFWALQALHFEKLLKSGRIFQARVLYILLTIVIGSAAGNFFLDYILWSRQLPLILQFVIYL